MKRSLLFSLMIIGVAAALAAGGGTFAYFSDSGNSTANVFTSGTLDVQLRNDSTGSWSDDVTGTWVTPTNWAPGDTVTAVLKFKNVGSVAAHSGLIDFQNAGCTGPNMFEKIQITSYQESVDGGTTWYNENVPGLTSVFDAPNVAPANQDGKLSLWELINGDTITPGTQSPSPYDLAIYNPTGSGPSFSGGSDLGAWGNNTDSLPFGNSDVLPANGTAVYAMKITFKFMEDAGNEYQNDTCTMNINTKWVQVPGVRPWTNLTGY